MTGLALTLEDVLRRHLGECGRIGLPCAEVRPRDEWCGRCDLTAHVAAAVSAWLAERLGSEEVREAVARSICGNDQEHWWPKYEDLYRADADAALAAVVGALAGES